MKLTELYDLYLGALAARDSLVIQIGFVGLCLCGIFALFGDNRYARWLLAGFVALFYLSLVGYYLVGQ